MATRSIPNTIQLAFPLEFAKSEGDALPSFKIVANTGKPMTAKGFYDPVIVNLAGAKFKKKSIPVIFEHKNTLAQRVGHTTVHTVSDKIIVEGTVSSSTPEALAFVKDAANGFPFEASLGANIQKAKFVEAGKTAIVNGKSYEGPLVIADKSEIYEVSVVLFGADPDTKSTVSFSLFGDDMTFDSYLDDLCNVLNLSKDDLKDTQINSFRKSYETLQAKQNNLPPPPPVIPPVAPVVPDTLELHNTQIANNVDRIAKIESLAYEFANNSDNPEFLKSIREKQTEAIKTGMSPEMFELTCRRLDRPQASKFKTTPINKENIDGQVLECALLQSFGTIPSNATNRVTGKKYGIENWYEEKVLNAADGMKSITLHMLMDTVIHAAGGYYTGQRGTKDHLLEVQKAQGKLEASGFSTLGITHILENVMHKVMLASFQSAESVWPFICGRRNLNDFKPHNLYRLSPDGAFRKVAQDGELKHISATDTKNTLQADTYGAMLTLDYKTLRNDDMGALQDRSAMFGMLGAQRVEESVFVLLLSNPGSFFASGNGNLLTGGGATALSNTSLDLARAAFRNQTINGKPILISPSIMLVPTTLETTANRLYTQESMGVGGSNADTGLVFLNNPHKGLYRPYVSPYLNNTGITDQDGQALSGQSDTQWYLMAPPSQLAAILIGFLDGRDTPYIESQETQFNIPRGIEMRAYFDWGVSMGDHQAAVKSPGA
jgi:hypothetical protein